MKAPGAAEARSNGASAQPPANSSGSAVERPATGVAGSGEREERFAREYLLDLCATRAYLRIRPKVAEATAATEGWKLLRKPEVQAILERLRAELFAKLDITAESVLRELALVGFSDVGHYQVDPMTGHLAIAEGEPLDRRRAVSSVKHKVVHVGQGEGARVEYHTELKLWDKVAALVKLGEHLKLWKGEDSHKRTEVIVDADGSVRIITSGAGT